MKPLTPSMSFKRLIAQRKAGAEVPPDTIHLEDGHNQVTVRLAGGYVTECYLAGRNGTPVAALYADDEPTKAKRNASHVMSPVGPNRGLGGQHGVYRWANFEGAIHAGSLMIQAVVDPDRYLALSKQFYFTNNSFITRTQLTNTTDKTVQTSLGEHLYWPLKDGRTDGLTLSFSRLDETSPLSSQANLQAIGQGKSHFWLPRTFGDCRVHLPDKQEFSMHAQAYMTHQDDTPVPIPVGMLLWRRAAVDIAHPNGSESICFEPAIGMQAERHDHLYSMDGSSQVGNEGLRLVAGASATLVTSIAVAR